ncbi:PEGA domain-containing protein [Candidatus Gottesmanbacteria bacterium]|nr:PEGA domain-containing protein [Candidatus Gottesmanbacteria bacterium]
MRRRLGFLVALLVVIALIFVFIKFLASRSPRQGELKVDSAPVASIFLNGKHNGRTPFQDKVTAGEYTIKIVPESTINQSASWEGKITVGPNLLTYVNANMSDSELTSAVDLLWLEKTSGKKSELSVTTNPDGATVMVDDQTKGVSPLTIDDLTPGDHSLAIASPGFAARNVKVRITSGFKLIATFKLALSGVAPEASSSAPTIVPVATITPAVSTKTATSSATPDPPKPFAIIEDTPTGFLRVRMEPSTQKVE